MTPNLGGKDRLLRLVFGAILISIVVCSPNLKIGYLGVLLLISAALAYCPVYALLDISSLPKCAGVKGPKPRRFACPQAAKSEGHDSSVTP